MQASVVLETIACICVCIVIAMIVVPIGTAIVADVLKRMFLT